MPFREIKKYFDKAGLDYASRYEKKEIIVDENGFKYCPTCKIAFTQVGKYCHNCGQRVCDV